MAKGFSYFRLYGVLLITLLNRAFFIFFFLFNDIKQLHKSRTSVWNLPSRLEEFLIFYSSIFLFQHLLTGQEVSHTKKRADAALISTHVVLASWIFCRFLSILRISLVTSHHTPLLLTSRPWLSESTVSSKLAVNPFFWQYFLPKILRCTRYRWRYFWGKSRRWLIFFGILWPIFL